MNIDYNAVRKVPNSKYDLRLIIDDSLILMQKMSVRMYWKQLKLLRRISGLIPIGKSALYFALFVRKLFGVLLHMVLVA